MAGPSPTLAGHAFDPTDPYQILRHSGGMVNISAPVPSMPNGGLLLPRTAVTFEPIDDHWMATMSTGERFIGADIDIVMDKVKVKLVADKIRNNA